MDTVRLGIIGFGQQGGMYSRILAASMVPGMTLGAICDRDRPRGKRHASCTRMSPCSTTSTGSSRVTPSTPS
jgi:predicted dehydrogenase